MSEEEEQSEFGAGIVICLAKFSEHFGTFWEMQVHHAIRWTKMTDEEKAKERLEVQRYPRGDAANRMRDVEIVLGGTWGDSDEKKISHYIGLWMNGASDHFYDLDRDHAPLVLMELADLCLKIGHGFRQDEIYGEETLKTIRQLWQQSCIEVDTMLGVEKPDWGRW